ncbi:amidohydrolase family protein [Paenibacillus doosanensis]|uniref:N-acetylglucosamine-6-phosphate deacetylase n=1 Tax=Paenibacillus konkukensis TaxID=2020716 RepID=A0ABY4RUY3_9BACL|nr:MULTISPECIES: amidohydrolase family protein [Paenibacillus]MCS7460976.1 amidohydrolase family protein [Paenibacillus doosanensis]UQZ85645.1 N-acetylglucosamine-6-phosphate deacetylase [Paenibacillus konkukensis]
MPRSVTKVNGIHYKTKQPVTIHIEHGRIQSLHPLDAEIRQAALPWVAPGLVDLQINGYFGADFNTIPIAEGAVERATRGLWRQGVTTYFPTVITNGDAEIEQAMRSIAAACAADPVSAAAAPGIHLEGPFISPEDGPRGAHDRSFTKAPDWPLFQRWQEAAQGRIKIVTLSPEWPGSAEFIERCVEQGVIVSIGHTAASPEQIAEAVQAGARMSTHLGNGAHLSLPRHPNYIWEQLSRDELAACVIADGFHLPDSVLKVTLRAKGEKALLVSDAVYLSGMEPGLYENHIGGRVVLTPEGRLHLAEHPGLLAGSAQLLPWGISHLLDSGLAELDTAWEMASLRPSALLNLPSQSGLAPGAPADLVLFELKRPQGVKIIQTYKLGERVFDSASPAKEANA